jgi:hypothetical protein
MLLMLTMLSGCVNEVSGDGASRVLERLEDPITDHAAALAGSDVALMRSTGRKVIAIYDAGVGPK